VSLKREIEDALAASKARLSPGMSETELRSVEERFGFRFAPDHRLMLSIAMPVVRPQHDGVGHDWPDWRNGDEVELRAVLERPTAYLLADVEAGAYWHAGWGLRPRDPESASQVARAGLATVPTLVPITGSRYIPAAPPLQGNPVVSTYGRDTIFLCANLVEYLRQGPGRGTPEHAQPVIRRIPFWSDLVEAQRTGAGAHRASS
jgi:hypothetical protein